MLHFRFSTLEEYEKLKWAFIKSPLSQTSSPHFHLLHIFQASKWASLHNFPLLQMIWHITFALISFKFPSRLHLPLPVSLSVNDYIHSRKILTLENQWVFSYTGEPSWQIKRCSMYRQPFSPFIHGTSNTLKALLWNLRSSYHFSRLAKGLCLIFF